MKMMTKKMLHHQLIDFQGRFHLVEGRCNRGTSNKYAKCQLTSDPNDPRRTQVKSPAEGYVKKTKRMKMIGRILFLLIPILGAVAMWYFYQDAF